MKRLLRALAGCLLAVTTALLLHFVCGRWLAGRDLIASLFARDVATMVAAFLLLGARLFLFLLAPGWALSRLAGSLLICLRARRQAPSVSSITRS